MGFFWSGEDFSLGFSGWFGWGAVREEVVVMVMVVLRDSDDFGGGGGGRIGGEIRRREQGGDGKEEVRYCSCASMRANSEITAPINSNKPVGNTITAHCVRIGCVASSGNIYIVTYIFPNRPAP